MPYPSRSLRELEAEFIAVTDGGWRGVDTIGAADGVSFLCPLCFEKCGGSIGCHLVICWSPSVGQEHVPRPGRWNLVGTSLDDLELVAGSSSVAIQGGCNAHFFVRAGRIVPA